MKIELGKQYRTRDGREVRIYAVDGRECEEVHGAFKDKNGGWVSNSWAINGLHCAGGMDTCDLIEVKPRIKRKVWVNVYKDAQRNCRMYANKTSADANCDPNRIACVEIDIYVEEGHGL